MSVNEFSTTIQLSHLLASELGLHGDQAIVIDTIYNTKEKVKDDNICDIIESLFHIKGVLKNLISSTQNNEKMV